MKCINTKLVALILMVSASLAQAGVKEGGGGDMVYFNGEWVLRDRFESSSGMLGTYYKPNGKIEIAMNAIIDQVVALTPPAYRPNTRNAMHSLFIDDAKYLFVAPLDCELLTFNSRTGQTKIDDYERAHIRSEMSSGLSSSVSYGCTFGDISYLGKGEIDKLRSAEEKALAMVHERLHTLKPYVSEYGDPVITYWEFEPRVFRGYTYYPKLIQNYHNWIAPFVAGVSKALSSRLNPASRTDAQAIEHLTSVSKRICLSYYKSECGDTNEYDPDLSRAEQNRNLQTNYFDRIFQEGLVAGKLRLKADLKMEGSGDAIASIGEKCVLTGPRSYEINATLRRGTEFTLDFKAGVVGAGSYFSNLDLTETSSSTRYKLNCESITDDRAIVRNVQEIRSVFELIP